MLDPWVEVSVHVEDRWAQYTDSPGIGPRVAWEESEPREIRHLYGDEFRYHRPTENVFIRIDDTLVTVIDVPTARPTIRADVGIPLR